MRIIDFVPPVILAYWRKIKPEKHAVSPLVKLHKKGQKMILIGNGPSLKQTMQLYSQEILKSDRLVVNYFAMTDYYEALRPNYYLMVDPVFFRAESSQKETVSTLIDVMIQKTEWSVMLCVPFWAKESYTIKRIKESNSNFSFAYIDTTARRVNQYSKFEMWDNNWTCPPIQNSINTAIYLSLYWEYGETYFVGVDMSALEEIRVDQETNELFSIDTHFYDSSSICKDKRLYDKQKRKILSNEWSLHEYLYAYALTFENFYELSKYAEYKGLKVYNASEYSWINCFERRKLK